jgi:hypothetical protein
VPGGGATEGDAAGRASVSGRLGVLVDLALGELRQRLVGLLFLSKCRL